MREVLLAGAACGVAALAVSRGRVFEPLRDRLGKGWAAELAACPLCLGAWLAAAATVCQGAPRGIVWPIAWGATWAVSAAVSGLLLKLYGEPE